MTISEAPAAQVLERASGAVHRLSDIAELRDGWYDGQGSAPSQQAIQRALAIVLALSPTTTELPNIFPTPEGGVSLEKSLPHRAATIEISASGKADFYATDLSAKRALHTSYDVNNPQIVACYAHALLEPPPKSLSSDPVRR